MQSPCLLLEREGKEESRLKESDSDSDSDSDSISVNAMRRFDGLLSLLSLHLFLLSSIQSIQSVISHFTISLFIVL